MKYKVGIVGYGVIGKAVMRMFKNKAELCIYDINLSTDDKIYLNMTSTDYEERDALSIDDCDFAFICVPTPHKKYDGLDMSIVESVVKQFSPGIFIVCSALQPGTADRLMKKYNKKIVVQPEYFGETVNHPLVNLEQQQFLILGGDSKDVDEVIKLYQKIYNANVKIRKVTAYEAEVIKLSENRAIAFKVAQCQELYDVCKEAGVDYNIIREAVYGDDPRFNLWWTFVLEENRGFNSKCIPKDVYGWRAWADEVECAADLTTYLLEYNKQLLSDNHTKEK